MAYPECARGRGVSHILAEKRGVSFTFKKMDENAPLQTYYSILLYSTIAVKKNQDPSATELASNHRLKLKII